MDNYIKDEPFNFIEEDGEQSQNYIPALGDPSTEMQLLLREWGLEELSERFEKNMIDTSVLGYMLESDITDLCRDLPMRYKLILRQKLKERYPQGIDSSDSSSSRKRRLSNSVNSAESCLPKEQELHCTEKILRPTIPKRRRSQSIVVEINQGISEVGSQDNIDISTKDFLVTRGLGRLVVPFQKANIAVKDFHYLKQNLSELETIVPSLRDQIDFINCVPNHMIDKSTQASLDPPVTGRETLTEICERSDWGQKFLVEYKSDTGKKVYSASSRKCIKNAMVEHFFRLGKGHISAQVFKEMLHIILKELPEEDPDTWFIPGNGSSPPSGLLYSRYRYLLQHDKRYREDKNQVEQPIITAPVQAKLAWNNLTEQQQNICRAAKNKLKNIDLINSKEDLLLVWKECFQLRQYEAATSPLCVKDWVISTTYGDILELLTFDFCIMHSETNNSLRKNVTLYVTKFKEIYGGYKSMMEEDKMLTNAILTTFINEVEITDKSIFYSIYALPLILRRMFINLGKRRIRPLLKNCRAAFIKHVKSEGLVTSAIAERKENATELGEDTGKPFIVAVGPDITQINMYYVCVDSVMFKCATVIDAVDLMFKIYNVFHIEYAWECELVLKFIQLYFYNIRLEGESRESNVTGFITDLNRH